MEPRRSDRNRPHVDNVEQPGNFEQADLRMQTTENIERMIWEMDNLMSREEKRIWTEELKKAATGNYNSKERPRPPRTVLKR
jgi:hypothetical protein